MAKSIKKTEEEKVRYVLAFVVLILFLFLAIIVFFKYVQGPTTLTELHKKNLEKVQDNEDAYIYEGFSFLKEDGLWHTQVGDPKTDRVYNVPLHYGPRDVKDVLVKGNFTKFWQQTINNNISKYRREAYLTYDLSQESQLSNLALAAGELSIHLAEGYGMALLPACINKNNTACAKIPLITCSNTKQPVIYLSIEDSLPVVATKGNCLIIQGREKDLVRSVDRFLLKLYGIMK